MPLALATQDPRERSEKAAASLVPRRGGLEVGGGLCELPPSQGSSPQAGTVPGSQALPQQSVGVRAQRGVEPSKEKAQSARPRPPCPQLPGSASRPVRQRGGKQAAVQVAAGQQCRIFMKALRNSTLKVV